MRLQHLGRDSGESFPDENAKKYVDLEQAQKK